MSRYGGYEDLPFPAEFYDFVPGYRHLGDLDFWLDLSRSALGPTLELGCGTGRVVIPTAAAGCEIVGLDLSEHMLARCRQKLSHQPEEVQARVRLLQANMSHFDLDETFGLITIPFRTFQHLTTVDDQLGCLQCARRHLAPRGKLVLDVLQVNPRMTYDPVFFEESEDFADVELPDGRRLRRTHRTVAYHRAEQYRDIEMIFYVAHPDGRAERLVQAFPFRWFSRYEVGHLLARCEFEVVDLFGNYDRSPLTDDSAEMIFVAEKSKAA